eukprot:CAMPEP_0174967702 /NCGR_PEP_ID=MMETSP0004_2-20121128/7726_1 /TAXON_ID=420556 /ORGANISM="Ochromonas sp., Strain CCMP1393" /LENGTH=72 /DNA_ID=CAMNT_0016216855 /DNA_START=46 /DNA_END=264 /DNA_ORIENTATION=+
MKSSRAAGTGRINDRKKIIDSSNNPVGTFNKHGLVTEGGEMYGKDGNQDLSKVLHLKFYNAFKDDFDDADLE